MLLLLLMMMLRMLLLLFELRRLILCKLPFAIMSVIAGIPGDPMGIFQLAGATIPPVLLATIIIIPLRSITRTECFFQFSFMLDSLRLSD